MARTTLTRPPTEEIVGENGELTEEWQKSFDELYAYLGEQQNLPDETAPLTEEQVQALIDTSITTALADVPTVRKYTEYIASAVKSNTITHNLGDANPQVTFDLDLNPNWLAWVRYVDENELIIEFQSGPATDMTVVVWTTEPES